MRSASFGMAAALSVALAAGPAEAKTCKATVVSASGSPLAPFATAKTLAVKAWALKVTQQFGAEWQYWRIAAGAIEACSSNGSGYTCTASAKPCKQ